MNEKILLTVGMALVLLSMAALPALAEEECSVGTILLSDTECQGNSLCNVRKCCGLVSGSLDCTVLDSVCDSCGVTTNQCKIGKATCTNTCEKPEGEAAKCIDCEPNCEELNFEEPTLLLYFEVFTKKNFAVTISPATQAAKAGETLSYKVTVRNLNPIDLQVLVFLSLPEGWAAEYPKILDMKKGESKNFVLKMTSNESSDQGIYPFELTIYNDELKIQDKFPLSYMVSVSQLPTIMIEPTSQLGVRGTTLEYTVSVRNNDPSGFDASSFAVSAKVPYAWSYDIKPKSQTIKPQETKTFSLKVTSNSTPALANTIPVNISTNFVSLTEEIEYRATYCGDRICQPGEETSCSSDCPSSNFACKGRCEKSTDSGISITASARFNSIKTIVCSFNSSADNCESAYSEGNCGYGKPCLCGSHTSTAKCSFSCVDTDGAYYMYGEDTKGNKFTSGNYSYVCPYVNLQGLISSKLDLDESKENYEMAKSTKKEGLNKAVTDDEKADIQPCYDALGSIISMLSEEINLSGSVIESPSISTVTDAKARIKKVQKSVDDLYNTHCRGAKGLIVIDYVEPPGKAEEKADTTTAITASNIGDIDYYGYAECEFTSPAKKTEKIKSLCDAVPAGTTKAFDVSVGASVLGDWSGRCSIYGSLKTDCSLPELHDVSETFKYNVYSKNIYVSSVSSSCQDGQIECTVKASSSVGSCAGCRLGNADCSLKEKNSNEYKFVCSRRTIGYYNITGYVFPGNECNPIEPNQKTITVRCAGCGDNIKDSGEQCEPPNSAANNYCVQPSWECFGNRFGERETNTLCLSNCQCQYTPFSYSCVGPSSGFAKCGANCSDGETRLINKTTPSGRCSCLQACNTNCGWDDCSCEAEIKPTTTLPTTETKLKISSAKINRASVILDSQEDIDVTVSNAGNKNKYAFAYCSFKSPSGKAKTSKTPCTIIYNISAHPFVVSVNADESGKWTVNSCSVNSSNNACASSIIDNTKTNVGTFTVSIPEEAPKALMTIDGTVRDKIILLNSVQDIDMTVKNPSAAKYGIVTCSFEKPSGRMITKTSACSLIATNSQQTFTASATADESGTWTVNSCSVYSSLSSSCINPLLESSKTSVGTFSVNTPITPPAPIPIPSPTPAPQQNVTPPTAPPQHLTLTTSIRYNTLLLNSLQNIDLSVSNPSSLGKYSISTCSFTKPGGSIITKTSACSLVSANSQRLFITSETADEPGTWTVSSCSVYSSSSSSCANPILENSKINVGTFTVNTPTPQQNITTIQNITQPLTTQNITTIQNITPTAQNITPPTPQQNITPPTSYVEPLTLKTTIRNETLLVNSQAAIDISVSNPSASTRYAKTSCIITNPAGETTTRNSQCTQTPPNSEARQTISFLADKTGVWTVISCSVYSSQPTCTSIAIENTEADIGTIIVVEQPPVSIENVFIKENILLNSKQEINVTASSPKSKYALAYCLLSNPDGDTISASSPCRLISGRQSFIVQANANMLGQWTVESCYINSSTQAACSSSAMEDTKTNIGIFTVSPLPPMAIKLVSMKNSLLLGALQEINVTADNPSAKYGLAQCSLRSPANIIFTVSSSCKSLAAGRNSFIASRGIDKPGAWSVDSCSVYSSQAQSCTNTVLEDSKQNAGAFQSTANISIVLSPSSQIGFAGMQKLYNLTITNSNPTTILFNVSVSVPNNWSYTAAGIVQAEAQGSITIPITITSGKASKGTSTFTVMINSTAYDVARQVTGTYVSSSCGDGICAYAESCEKDCNTYPYSCHFVTPYGDRCERQTNSGAEFSASIDENILLPTFVACEKSSSEEKCLNDFNSRKCDGTSCLCGSREEMGCKADCVDRDGIYYLLTEGTVDGDISQFRSANFTYSCPNVNLEGIKALKNRYVTNKANYEDMKIELTPLLKDEAKRPFHQPCYDALGEVIKNITLHIDYLNNVIKRPTTDNTKEARTKSSGFDRYADNLLDSMCLGRKGLLKIALAPLPEKIIAGAESEIEVIVENVGDAPYYGYVSCDLTGPNAKKITAKPGECFFIGKDISASFRPRFIANATGNWTAQCSVYASLTSDCGSVLHDTKPLGTFEVVPAVPVQPARRECSTNITSSKCYYNPGMKRYVVSLTAEWSGGSHAHGKVDNVVGRYSYYESPFTHTDTTAGPGWKDIAVEIHDGNDVTQCFADDEAYCDPVNVTETVMEVLRIMDDIARPGRQRITLLINPDINTELTFTELAESIVDDYEISGNKSAVSPTEKKMNYKGSEYNAYVWAMKTEAGKQINITYTTIISEPGSYTFTSLARYEGKEDEETKTMRISGCAQITPVYAMIEQSCRQFATPCDVPKGWKIVSSCPEDIISKKDGTTLIILIAVIIIIIAIAIIFRRKIREKIEDFRFWLSERFGKEKGLEGETGTAGTGGGFQ